MPGEVIHCYFSFYSMGDVKRLRAAKEQGNNWKSHPTKTWPNTFRQTKINLGHFLSKTFDLKFWKLSVSNGGAFFSICSKLAIPLVDQKRDGTRRQQNVNGNFVQMER